MPRQSVLQRLPIGDEVVEVQRLVSSRTKYRNRSPSRLLKKFPVWP
ncbi:hypothetical protein ILFOPFJJ_06996 [Ensifer psoraleae]|nr:hypothetical protein [Sinorhizobium psoraleae]